VLDPYEAPDDPAYPVIGFDESPKQSVGEFRTPLAMDSAAPTRQGVE
jgi:hypothetical protein